MSAAARVSGPREPPTLAAMLFLAAALFALVLPIVGPLDDHHFAERAHNHDHVYLNGARVGHHHVYGAAAQHAHPDARAHSRVHPYEWDGMGSNRDVFYLMPAASGLTLASLNAPCHPAPESLRLPPAGKQVNPLEGFTPTAARARGEHVLPLLPPPVI